MHPIIPLEGGAQSFIVYVIADSESSIMGILKMSDEVSVDEGWQLTDAEIIGKAELGSSLVFRELNDDELPW